MAARNLTQLSTLRLLYETHGSRFKSFYRSSIIYFLFFANNLYSRIAKARCHMVPPDYINIIVQECMGYISTLNSQRARALLFACRHSRRDVRIFNRKFRRARARASKMPRSLLCHSQLYCKLFRFPFCYIRFSACVTERAFRRGSAARKDTIRISADVCGRNRVGARERASERAPRLQYFMLHTPKLQNHR